MKKITKIFSVLFALVILMQCFLIPASASKTVAKIEIIEKPKKEVYYYLADWDYGYFRDENGSDDWVWVDKPNQIALFHNACYGYFPNEGCVNLDGLKVKVTYSDGTSKTIEYAETVKPNSAIVGNIYFGLDDNYTLGVNKVYVYLPGQSKVLASFNITISNSLPAKKGDVNMDGYVNSIDALIVLKISVGSIVDSSKLTMALGDLNNDSKINSSDALLILKQSVSK